MRDGSQVFSIVCNRLRLVARNRLFIALCIMLPLLFSLMVNRIFTKSSLYDSIPIGIIDQDKSLLSQHIIEEVKSNPSILLETIEENEIERYISREKVQAVYIFKQGFQERIESGKYDDIISVYAVPGSITAMGISDIVAGEIMPFICEYKVINAAEKLIPEEERQKIKIGISSRMEKLHLDKDFELPVLVDERSPKDFDVMEEAEDRDIFSISIGLGLVVIFSTIFMLTGCSTIIKERENKVRSRIRSAGVSASKLIFADILAVAAAGVLITFLQFILINSVLREVSAVGLGIITLLMVTYALSAASMLILFAAVFPKHVSFQSFMPVVILIMGILSGCIWSLELMPEALEKLSVFMPTYWVHSGLVEIILYGSGIKNVGPSFVMLGLSIGIFSIPGYLLYKRQ